MSKKDDKPLSYIDTQGMGAPLTPEESAKWKARGGDKQVHKPAITRPMRLITPMMAKELKILINEVLDEREYKKSLKGPYDIHGEVDELPPSYFDTEHFKHPVGEEEPPYKDWSQE